MYFTVLLVHSWIRWAVVIFGVAVLFRAFASRGKGEPSTPADDKLALGYVASLDLQVLLGFWLYFSLSPLGLPLMREMKATMQNHVLRFWAVEHFTGMVLALVLAHVGNVIAKRAEPQDRPRKRMIWLGLSLLLVLLSIPWPFLPYGRPLFRFGM